MHELSTLGQLKKMMSLFHEHSSDKEEEEEGRKAINWTSITLTHVSLSFAAPLSELWWRVLFFLLGELDAAGVQREACTCL